MDRPTMDVPLEMAAKKEDIDRLAALVEVGDTPHHAPPVQLGLLRAPDRKGCLIASDIDARSALSSVNGRNLYCSAFQGERTMPVSKQHTGRTVLRR